MSDSNDTKTLTGGCLCGAVRYEMRDAPLRTVHCHCDQCRRSSGAPFMTWFVGTTDNFNITQGEVASFASSETATRRFCPTCGTQLIYAPTAAPQITVVSVGSLDDPAAVEPGAHIYMKSYLAWAVPDDDLPRHDEHPA